MFIKVDLDDGDGDDTGDGTGGGPAQLLEVEWSDIKTVASADSSTAPTFRYVGLTVTLAGLFNRSLLLIFSMC